MDVLWIHCEVAHHQRLARPASRSHTHKAARLSEGSAANHGVRAKLRRRRTELGQRLLARVRVHLAVQSQRLDSLGRELVNERLLDRDVGAVDHRLAKVDVFEQIRDEVEFHLARGL